MVLWVDSYRPKGFSQLDIHPQITDQLQRLARHGDIPHILFYGPSGAGKKTRIVAFLRELFGPGVEKVRIAQRSIQTKSKTIEISSLTSSYHTEINPSDAGNADTIVVQEVIKDIAQTHSVTAKARAYTIQSSNSSQSMDDNEDNIDEDGAVSTTTTTTTTTTSKRATPSFKVVVLHEIDRLSTDAQHGLRRTMEQYTKSCRLILCAESAHQVTAPLKSRCLMIRVPSPSDIEIARVLQRVVQSEKLNVTPQILTEIIEYSEGDMRRALLSLETTVMSNLGNPSTMTVKHPDWELIIAQIAQQILTNQSPTQLLAIRAQFYQLLTNCIPPTVILERLCLILSAKLNTSSARHSILRWAAFYDQRLTNSTKAVVHLEAFTAKAMAMVVIANQ